MVKPKACPWCKYNPKCGKHEDCDFRTLPMKKEAIITRIKEEVEWINEAKRKVVLSKTLSANVRTLLFGIFDRMKGLDLMVKILQVDFGMSEEEVKVYFKKESLTSYQKLKFMRMVAMGMARGGKNGNR
jgi:hypothetical protein